MKGDNKISAFLLWEIEKNSLDFSKFVILMIH